MFLANHIAGFFKVQYLKKEVRCQVDFLYVNKHQSFLQGDAVVFACVVRVKVPKITSLQYLSD